MLLICHFGGKAKRPRSTAADSSDSEVEENVVAVSGTANANAVGGAQRRHSMSASLMSCVRENSPPLDIVDVANSSSTTGPMSLPDCRMSTMSTINPHQQTSTPITTPNVNESSSSGGVAGGGGDGTATNAEPKRRRFHPLRNLRRIFRRRTITSVADTPPPGANTSSTLPPPTSSISEKNLRSATLSSISSVVSASSPSSPLTHQQLQDAYSSQSLPKSKSYSISAVGVGSGVASSSSASKSPHRDALLATVLGGKHKHQQTKQQQQLHQQLEEALHDDEMYTTTTPMYHHHQHQQVGSSGGVLFQPPHTVRQSLGVAVLPSAMNRSFYAERQKLHSVGDSSQELDSSGNDSGSATGTTSNNNTASGSGGSSANGGRTIGCVVNNEMTDSQRSLSEGRLVDSDYSHDPLSQSHDSVFSESASASLFSNRDYQAELSDVLRKRNRHRQDASEEDLGLPRSPASPQRHAERTHRSYHAASGSGNYNGNNSNNHNNVATPSSATGNQSEVSSLSLLSMNSADGDEMLATSTANNSAISTKEIVQERSLPSSLGARGITRASTISTTSVSSEIYRHSSSGSLGSDSNRDEPDLIGAKCQRLSHSAAKHKMALRPAKKKVPSRQHRRTLETSIPEANEDSLRLAGNALLDISEHDIKAKTRSLPPGVNTKILEKHVVDSKKVASPLKSKTKSPVSANEQILNIKRSKIDRMEKCSEDNKTSISTSTSISSTSLSVATNLFGLRTLTAKATALFEPPQESSTDPTPSEQEFKKEKEKEKLKEKDASNTIMETTESGFLRRLIQRNSKRSVSRTNTASSAYSNSTNKDEVAAEDKVDMSQSEHESKSKMQVSTSCFDMKLTPESSATKLEKCRSALSYEQNIEEIRKDIKREILSVGSTGLNTMLNTHNLTSHNNSTNNIKEATTSPQKPKSGAAARQRYMPQDISSLDRKTASSSSTATTATTASESYTSSTSSILSKCSQQEIFQSTSIIREITASQASSVNSLCSLQKSEHHFEKKPKIVGLSAFQQKISRSNDSVGRFASSGNNNSSSTNSLDAVSDTLSYKNQEQKQRKLVEKSRSFRTYQEDSFSTTMAVHNNMPSLPDLTLNLRVPCYNDFALKAKETKMLTPDHSTSLGFEVSEENVVCPTTPRTEFTGNLTASSYNFSKNVIVKSSPTKVVALSPTKNCVQEQDAVDVNSELLVKSPFINVLRKPTSTTSIEEKSAVVTVAANINTKSMEQSNITKTASAVSVIAVVPPTPEVTKVAQLQQTRPKVLHLRDSNTSVDTSTSTDDAKPTPTTPAVLMREKPKLQTNVTVGNVRNSMDVLAASQKDVERKSAPTPVVQMNKVPTGKTTQRSSSVLDNPPSCPNDSEERAGERNAIGKNQEPTSGSSTPNADGVPEFMRIQLNRVDPARIAKSANVVLAKNVRETHSPPQQQLSPQHQQSQQQQKIQQTKEANERNSHLDDLSLRRLSNESVEIIEKSSPTEMDKQKSVFVMSQNNTNISNRSPTKVQAVVSALPPRSPVKKQLSAVATTPTTPTDAEDAVLLRTKAPETPADAAALSSNKLSLQERKRLFMGEEKLKTDKRIEELRNERKKSITEEVYRKSFAKSEEKLETSEKAATESVVMLRKKSFCATMQAGVASTNGNRDDPTPELMKVFARRSLKIKDEDINALADKIHASNGSVNSAKKFVSTQQNVDSDKENQSASEEKLDKLPKLEASLETQTHVGGKLTNGLNNRNSLADFRMKSVAGSNTAISNGLSLNNSSNNNNNNNNHTVANSNNSTTTGGHAVSNTTANNVTVGPTTNGINGCSGGGGGSNRSFLPPIKVAGFRAIPIERNNSVSKIYPTTACEALNNNNNNNSNNLNNNNHNQNPSHHHHQQQNGKSNERQSLNIKSIESSSSANGSSSNSSSSSVNANNKTIERSATVSEFKGIHQRRAEWEQRAKEALK